MVHEQLRSQFDFIPATVHRAMGSKSSLRTVFVLNLVLVFLVIYPHSIYIRVYPQDIFGFLDGIHRTVSGQIPNRDFSSPMGPIVYALPALFVRFGANELLSLAYAQAALLILNFLVILHLLRTRLPGLSGLLFGLWVSLLLASRMNLGDAMQYVTFAENYNRWCTAAFSALLIFFISPHNTDAQTTLTDVIILSGLALILFYTKMTYFMVALAALVLLSFTSGTNIRRVIAAVTIFLIVIASLEAAYGFHGGYFSDLFMAAQASGAIRGNMKGMLNLIQINLPELIICCVLPLLVLYQLGILKFLSLVLFLFVAAASLLLMNQSAQSSVLAVPFTLLFITLDMIDRRAELDTQHLPARALVYTTIVAMSFWYSYPLVLNNLVSFAKSISDIRPIGTGSITERFLIDWDDTDPELRRELVTGSASSFDIFARARQSATNIPGMKLNETEYAISIEDGVKAARDYCGANPRILTVDHVNPFPAILDLPVAGKFILFDGVRIISADNPPLAEQIFGGITCIMYPKMPVSYSARELFVELYHAYIARQYEIKGKTDFWIVYTLIKS